MLRLLFAPKNRFRRFAAELVLLLVLCLSFRQSGLPSYTAADQYRLHAADDPIPSVTALYTGKTYTVGSHLYSAAQDRQLVCLSGDGLYHKKWNCAATGDAVSMAFYAAVSLLDVSPCPACSAEDGP